MGKIPKIIYLQVEEDKDFEFISGITWCSHRINNNDMKYVLAIPTNWLDDLRRELYQIISVGEFETIEIDTLFQKYGRKYLL